MHLKTVRHLLVATLDEVASFSWVLLEATVAHCVFLSATETHFNDV